MKNMKFEEAMKNLENIVEKLEDNELELEQSLKLYEEGVKLVKLCHFKLEEIEKKVEILTKGKDGKITAKSFESEDKIEEGEKNEKEDTLF